MKLQRLAILLIIIASLVPVYAATRYLQKIIRPRASLARLLLYLISSLAVVFLFTFAIVFLIRRFFKPAA